MTDQNDACPVDRWTEALGWYSTLRSADEQQPTTAMVSAWQDWYADAQNRRTFDDVSRLLGESHLYDERPRRSKAELGQDRYDLSVPIADWLSGRAHPERIPRRSAASRWLWLSSGLAVAGILALLVSPRLQFRLSSYRTRALYLTGVGGQKEVYLPDGSRITLGGRTTLLVTLSARRRSVDLIKGQAWFRVAHDSHWPFVVSAGDGSIADIGTAFLVTRDSDRVVVTVTEGTVEVSTKASMRFSLDPRLFTRPAASSIRVGRGQQLIFGDNGALSGATPADTRAATDWADGRLTFQDQSLRYVIETIHRYSSQRIIVSPEVGRLRLSGVVFENDIQRWLRSLEVVLPVTEQAQGNSVRIQMRHPPRSSTRPNMEPAGR